MLSKTGKELMSMLKEIRYDRDFVCGVMSNAPTDEAWGKMIDYIKIARRKGDFVSSDELSALSIVLGRSESEG